MTDDLVKRLWDIPDPDTHAAADRIEQLERELSISRMAQVVMDNSIEVLTAERDKYEAAWMTAEGELADADAMIEAQAKDHASNNIRFAEATHRIKDLTEKNQSLALDHLAALGQAAEQIEALTAERDALGRQLNIARYGQPDFAWSIHKAAMADLQADNARMVEALEFYADLSRDGPWHLPAEDYGKIARAALNTGKEPGHD